MWAVVAFAFCVHRSIGMFARRSAHSNFLLLRNLLPCNTKNWYNFRSKTLLWNVSFVRLKVKMSLAHVTQPRRLKFWLSHWTSNRHLRQQVYNLAIQFLTLNFKLWLVLHLLICVKWYWNNKFFLLKSLIVFFILIKFQIQISNLGRHHVVVVERVGVLTCCLGVFRSLCCRNCCFIHWVRHYF